MSGVGYVRRGIALLRAWAPACVAGGFIAPALGQVGQPHVETFTVQAATEWHETGIYLLPGDQILVRPSQAPAWTNAAGGELKNADGWGGTYAGTKVADAPLAALILRIGSDDPGQVITRETITVSRRGRLAFGMNDLPGTYDDNQGALPVSVRYLQQVTPMPQVLGMDESVAARQFLPFGIVAEVRFVPSPSPRGQVLDTVPPQDSEMHAVDSVLLIVSEGPPVQVQVPDIVGMHEQAAMDAVVGAGLAPTKRGTERSTLQSGLVTRSRPDAGTLVEKNTTVEYWVAQAGGAGSSASSSGSASGSSSGGNDESNEDGWVYWLYGAIAAVALVAIAMIIKPTAKPDDPRAGPASPTITAGLDPDGVTKFKDKLSRSSGDVYLRVSLEPGGAAFPGETPITGIEVGDE